MYEHVIFNLTVADLLIAATVFTTLVVAIVTGHRKGK